jgi:ParB-like chromosome segregation protein Spo0J
MKTQALKAHWVADIFPLNESDVDRIAEDIKTNGQRQPILIYNEQIIDGRTRFAACKKVGIDPLIEEYKPENGEPDDEELLSLSWSLNETRRHLSTSQRACAAAEVIERLPAEAKKRSNPLKRISSTVDRYGISQDIVKRARELLTHDPAAFLECKAGKQTVGAAYETLQLKCQVEKEQRQRNDLQRLKELDPDLAEQVETGKLTQAQADAKLEEQEKAKRERENTIKALVLQFFMALSGLENAEKDMRNLKVLSSEISASRKGHQRDDDLNRCDAAIKFIQTIKQHYPK